MRWVRFTAKGRTAYGIIDGEPHHRGQGRSVRRLRARPATTHALADVTIEMPVVPPTSICVGLNYAEHVRDGRQEARHQGRAARQARMSAIAPTMRCSLTAATSSFPRDATEKIHYEGELVVVIGKRCRNVSEADALNYVLGYTIGNDVSERTWQKGDRTLWRAKNTDTFKPMGPWIETDVDLDKLETRVRVNGTETDALQNQRHDPRCRALYLDDQPLLHARAAATCFGWARTTSRRTSSTATSVEVEITGLGVLRNRFVREGAAEPVQQELALATQRRGANRRSLLPMSGPLTQHADGVPNGAMDRAAHETDC